MADSPTFSRVEPRSLAAISFGAPPASRLPPFDEAQNSDGMVALSPIKRPARSAICKSQVKAIATAPPGGPGAETTRGKVAQHQHPPHASLSVCVVRI